MLPDHEDAMECKNFKFLEVFANRVTAAGQRHAKNPLVTQMKTLKKS